jgi:hypothetical protein
MPRSSSFVVHIDELGAHAAERLRGPKVPVLENFLRTGKPKDVVVDGLDLARLEGVH